MIITMQLIKQFLDSLKLIKNSYVERNRWKTCEKLNYNTNAIIFTLKGINGKLIIMAFLIQ